jgi:hypothetical protein
MPVRFICRHLPVVALTLMSVAPVLAQGGPYRFYPLTPCRLVDTRAAEGPVLEGPASNTRTFQVRGKCGVPTEAKAAALNVTAFNPTRNGHLRAWPSGTAMPNTSILNYQTATVIANGAIVPLSTDTQDLAIFAFLGASPTAADEVHVIIDVTGYFAPVAP